MFASSTLHPFWQLSTHRILWPTSTSNRRICVPRPPSPILNHQLIESLVTDPNLPGVKKRRMTKRETAVVFHEMNETLNEMTQRPFDDISIFCLDCILWVVVQSDSLHEKTLSRKRLVSSRKKRHAAVNHRDPQIRPPSTAEWSCEMFANNSDRVGDQPASSQSFWSQHTSWWCFPRSLAQLNSASHRPSYIRLKQNTNIQVFLSTPSPQSKKYDDLNLDLLKSICNDFWNVPRISLFQRSFCRFCCFPVLLQMTRFHCFLLNWEEINWLCWCFNESAYRSPFKCSLSRVRIDHDRS